MFEVPKSYETEKISLYITDGSKLICINELVVLKIKKLDELFYYWFYFIQFHTTWFLNENGLVLKLKNKTKRLSSGHLRSLFILKLTVRNQGKGLLVPSFITVSSIVLGKSLCSVNIWRMNKDG